MLLDEKPLDSLTLEDVNLLITEGICESSRLDYKRDWWGGSEGGRREMLRDISSLANSNGGYLVIGLETERGSGGGNLECSIEIVGLEPIDYQEIVIRSSRDGLNPPCRGVEAAQIEVGENSIVLVIRVPQSLDAPHMVTYKGLNQFWQRHGTDKQPMSTQEIRDSFVSRLTYRDEIFEYAQRNVVSLQRAEDDRRLIYMWAAPVVPLLSEVDVKSQELRVLSQEGLLNNLPFNPDLYCGQARPCLDGIEAELSASERTQFIRLRRNGFLEFGTDRTLATRVEQADCIHAFAFSAILENFSTVVGQVLEKLEVQGPVALGCSMINVQGLKLFIGSRYLEPISQTSWNRAILDLGHQVTYDFASEKTLILRGISDRLWNAFHYNECVFYESGELVPPG